MKGVGRGEREERPNERGQFVTRAGEHASNKVETPANGEALSRARPSGELLGCAEEQKRFLSLCVFSLSASLLSPSLVLYLRERGVKEF